MNALGNQVRSALGAGPEELRLQRQRVRFTSAASERKRGPWRELTVGLVCAALGSVAVLTLWHGEVPLKVESSDGSTVVFNDGSRLEVGQFGSMHLERGAKHEVVVAIDY